MYRGGSLAYLASLVPDGLAFGFDTFSGMPDYWPGEPHMRGEFVCPIGDVRDYLDRLGLDNVQLVGGKFPLQSKLPLGISPRFVHVDVEHGETVHNCLTYLYSRLDAGAYILIDGYGRADAPNVLAVVNSFVDRRLFEPIPLAELRFQALLKAV